MLGELGSLFDQAEKRAEELEVACVVAAVDPHGNLVLLMRMEGAPEFAIHMATRKAYTAISMRLETAALAPLVQPGQQLFGLIEASGGRLLPFGGGAPVTLDNRLLALEQVSREGTTQQDVAVSGIQSKHWRTRPSRRPDLASTIGYQHQRKRKTMVDPYVVVAVSPRTINVKNPGDGVANVKRINEFIDTAVMVGAWEGSPVKLVVLPEMAIQGMIANTPGNRERGASLCCDDPWAGDGRAGKEGRGTQHLHLC